MRPNQTIELPHDASINVETNKIIFSLGNVNLVFTLEEWMVFCEMVDDINIAIQTNTVESTDRCMTCGHTDTLLLYEEPQDDEIN